MIVQLGEQEFWNCLYLIYGHDISRQTVSAHIHGRTALLFLPRENNQMANSQVGCRPLHFSMTWII